MEENYYNKAYADMIAQADAEEAELLRANEDDVVRLFRNQDLPDDKLTETVLDISAKFQEFLEQLDGEKEENEAEKTIIDFLTEELLFVVDSLVDIEEWYIDEEQSTQRILLESERTDRKRKILETCLNEAMQAGIINIHEEVSHEATVDAVFWVLSRKAEIMLKAQEPQVQKQGKAILEKIDEYKKIKHIMSLRDENFFKTTITPTKIANSPSALYAFKQSFEQLTKTEQSLLLYSIESQKDINDDFYHFILAYFCRSQFSEITSRARYLFFYTKHYNGAHWKKIAPIVLNTLDGTDGAWETNIRSIMEEPRTPSILPEILETLSQTQNPEQQKRLLWLLAVDKGTNASLVPIMTPYMDSSNYEVKYAAYNVFQKLPFNPSIAQAFIQHKVPFKSGIHQIVEAYLKKAVALFDFFNFLKAFQDTFQEYDENGQSIILNTIWSKINGKKREKDGPTHNEFTQSIKLTIQATQSTFLSVRSLASSCILDARSFIYNEDTNFDSIGGLEAFNNIIKEDFKKASWGNTEVVDNFADIDATLQTKEDWEIVSQFFDELPPLGKYFPKKLFQLIQTSGKHDESAKKLIKYAQQYIFSNPQNPNAEDMAKVILTRQMKENFLSSIISLATGKTISEAIDFVLSLPSCKDFQYGITTIIEQENLSSLTEKQSIAVISRLFQEGRIRLALKIPTQDKQILKEKKWWELILEKIDLQSREDDSLEKIIPLLGHEVVRSFFSKNINTIQHVSDILSCVEKNVITAENINPLPEYLENISIIIPELVQGFLDAKSQHREKEFFARVQYLMENSVHTGKDSEQAKTDPLFKKVIEAVYQNNSGHWGKRAVANQMPDNTEHLADYKIDEKYIIDTAGAVEISVKEGQAIDTTKFDAIKDEFYAWSREFSAMGFDSAKMQAKVTEEIDALLAEIKLESEAKTVEEKMFLLLARSTHNSEFPQEKFKRLLIGYQFAFYEDIQAYIQGTSDRVKQATNQDYAYLQELHAFFADSVKEIFRKGLEKANANGFVDAHLESTFNALREHELTSGKQEQLNRLQPEKATDMDALYTQLIKVLEGKGKNKLEATAGMIQTRINRVAQIAELVGNTKFSNPETIHLGEITLEELLQSESEIAQGSYNPETFQKYLAQKFLGTFSGELKDIEGELNKFEAKTESGESKKIKKLNAYITKNSASAHARMVGGVCVSSDEKQWNDPSYLQMVFQDPDDYTCKGLCLMHVWEEKGEKHLIVSANPSSTYLYTVDEKAFFTQMMKQIEKFASDNNIDTIGFSTNTNIRTNRTAGLFEQAMNEQIQSARAQYGKKASLQFPEQKQFSWNPQYHVDTVDIVWRKEAQKKNG